MISTVVRTCFPKAAAVVQSRAEDINKLNVFPVPDGDTGTNMSLTLGTVVSEIQSLPADATMDDIAAAITHGSLMGARGNSGVITSQILRGIAEGLCEAQDQDNPTSQDIARAFKRGQKVAFKAVRKPVEGTILTVLKDVTSRAEACAHKKLPVEETMQALVIAAYESVARTPDLLPVLKENGVVDSGAYGFATFLEAFVNAYLGQDVEIEDFSTTVATEQDAHAKADAKVEIELNDDWEGSEYRYCTEFLFHAEQGQFDEDETLAFLSSQGDCELLVGSYPDFKIHVHVNRPDIILAHMLEMGQIFEVYIHNMDLEAKDRTAKIAADKNADAAEDKPKKDLGFVAVAAGSGEAEILRSLGVDVVLSGGQTMNPSTADILRAIESAHADNVIVMPDNSNIRMAADAAATACDTCQVHVVPTRTVPQAFAAMIACDRELGMDDMVQEMTEAAQELRGGEVTHAVRDSQTQDGTPIHTGDIIGLMDGKIEICGAAVKQVTLELLERMQEEEEGDTLTILAGQDMDDEDFQELCETIEERYPDMEVDAHRGEQPLYPIVFSLE